MSASQQDKDLYRDVGRKHAIALAQNDLATSRFLEEWRQGSLRLARPTAVHDLMEAFLEGKSAANEQLHLKPRLYTLYSPDNHARPVLSKLGRLLRLKESIELALSRPWVKFSEDQAICLHGLGIEDQDACLLDMWALEKGVPLLEPLGGDSKIKRWPAGLMIEVARLHTRRYDSSDLPNRFIGWALSLTHQAEPRSVPTDGAA